ncbi:hypothetical protein KAFR_0C01600 [Kazachstania africana CBS 2517]|uniref:Prokaryotic-type class I peptide chain release factors domain-containing protein n=1 Tax=Kazachstania africana (strain ATCC 22294 / BCRC 22015 / CBS 2517 / CECT 1963 / NBRC 1671 / NRRL Y-8276) TaxID=1071382 RepID=H2AS03_KAZAF|nr:hypothetical protein KAFR_0C01600 [Kazachstania africana CBS 2517]CCF57153.1 hypothetical protein KAFR_0C01600 [Kazachstania africana CBS 2517]
MLKLMRFISTENNYTTELLAAKRWLQSLKPSTFPQKLFKIRYDRSSGPGGQNVNKVNTKCTMTLSNFSKCTFFPESIRSQLLSRTFRYYVKKSDLIVVSSDEARSREINRQICINKLISEINENVYFPKERTLEEKKSIKEKSSNVLKTRNERRLLEKKQNASKKKLRHKYNVIF